MFLFSKFQNIFFYIACPKKADNRENDFKVSSRKVPTSKLSVLPNGFLSVRHCVLENGEFGHKKL